MTSANNNVEKYYDNVSRKYDDLYLDAVSRAEDNIIQKKLLKITKPGDNILDLGCGTGLGYSLLNGIDCNYIGIDISKNMISIAREKFPEVTFHHADIVDLSNFSSGSIDVIISLNGAVSHVEDYKKTINECHRVLKRNGKLFIMLYNKKYFLKRQKNSEKIYSIRNFNKEESTFAKFWTEDDVQNEFSSYSKVNINGFNFIVDKLKGKLNYHIASALLNIEYLLPCYFNRFCHSLIVEASK
ncbi:class I SAM-dependent methyltransferase [Photorhabdus sp. CRCIA-P01]|uniref:class I SAM-dependent methyltransferase n=1 Tax=Photorhabdus sp. CRCIA-P01 TaxID=2019570 RepID=UPI000E59EB74|nr:class I SAM-dependent methyltransferase [Photorhabdus sp. CRCIA-P01]